MKILKTLFIIWVALLGIIVVLFLFKDVKKSKVYQKFRKFIDEDDDEQ